MLAVYGTNKKSEAVFDYLRNEGSDIVFVKEMESSYWKDVSPSIGFDDMINLYQSGKLEKIVVRFECYPQLLDREFLKYNVDFNDVYIAFYVNNEEFRIEPYLKSEFMPYLEYHVTDHCNMNCKYCEHYSGLCKDATFVEPERLLNDLTQLKKHVKHINKIRILGGEPLLHKELSKFVEGTRKLYPTSKIRIVTNGLLVTQMSDDLCKCIIENDAAISISYYPPLVGHIEKLDKFLENKGVTHYISNLMDCFTCKQVLKPHDEELRIFNQCYQSTCHNVYGGKLGVCFLPFMTKYFNDYYDESIPAGETVDLYDESLSYESIIKYLHKPIERCKYCTEPVEKTWARVTHPSNITDWVNV